ncbi:zinc ribbon domain-containing protein, partial [Streptomyces sp. SB3404]
MSHPGAASRAAARCHGCSAEPVPGAAFCGECGTRLATGDGPGDGPGAGTIPAPSPPSSPPAPPPPRWGGSRDLTRYMCAAVFLNRSYADTLIRDVVSEPHLGVAPAPGCDVSVVARHAYEANVRRHARDLLLTVELLVLLVGLVWLGSGGAVVLMLLLAWLTVLVFTLSTRYGARFQSFRPGRFDPAQAPPPPNRAIARRLREIDDYALGNVTVYSGFSAFTGYGSAVDAWSLNFDVTVPSEEGGTPRDFDVTDLYTYVRERVGALSLPCLEIEERVFVDGSEVLGDARFLPDP